MLEHIRCTDVEVAVIYPAAALLGHINQAPIVAHIDAIVVEHSHTRTQTQTEVKSFQTIRRENIWLRTHIAHRNLVRSKQTNTKVGTKRAKHAHLTLPEHIAIADV